MKSHKFGNNHLKLKNYDRKSDLPYGIRGFHDDV